MAVKKCCIENCNSCSTRKEDIGVTYHKFPKDTTLRNNWITVTRKKHTELPLYVCSRHFRKRDFQNKDSKYVLKKDAVPSIFSWKITNKMDVKIIEALTSEEQDNDDIQPNNVMNSSKESESENVDAIKQFIADQEKEISNQKSDDITEEKSLDGPTDQDLTDEVNEDRVPLKDDGVKKINNEGVKENKYEGVREKEDEGVMEFKDENMVVAENVIDMILYQSERKTAKKKGEKSLDKPIAGPGDKGTSMALSVGSRVEAKDYGESWYPAEILEVDYDEMEVLVHYVNTNIVDEWMCVSTSRLRPTGSISVSSPAPTQSKGDKLRVVYAVGERCLARWRDNKRFIATITEDFGEGKYEVMFDDGVRWTCNTSRLRKLKDTPARDSITSYPAPVATTSSLPSPVFGHGPCVSAATPIPSYNNHLFDPARDYLGSKSERREKKRKLNIKEIFNIGQKKRKVDKEPIVKVTRVVKDKKPKVNKTLKLKPEGGVDFRIEVKNELPDAVASIIGTVMKEEEVMEVAEACDVTKPEVVQRNYSLEMVDSETLSAPESQNMQLEDTMIEEEKLQKFEPPDDVKHEEVIDKIKEAISKLEDGLNQDTKAETKVIPKEDVKDEKPKTEDIEPVVSETAEDKPKMVKDKKAKKLRLLQEKQVKIQVDKVKSELEDMKIKFEEMRKEMLEKTEELAKRKQKPETAQSFLLPGEWCCKWVNGQPVGMVSELEREIKVDGNNRPALPRRSVQVEDKRLPEGWTKHMVRRSFGHSAGKWDVVLVSPDNRRFHTKTDMRHYLENNPSETLKPYENALYDFGIHLKLARRLGWYTTTPGGEEVPVVPLPAGTLASTSPLVKRKKLSLNKKVKLKEKRKLCIKLKVPKEHQYRYEPPDTSGALSLDTPEIPAENVAPPLEDGYVYVGSLKVQVIENLLRCPADGCFKNFRNNTLLKMHIKHYHRDLRKMLGTTPAVLDLAYARTRPGEMRRLKLEARKKTIKVKLPRLPKRTPERKMELQLHKLDAPTEVKVQIPTTPVKTAEDPPKTQDSPKLRDALNSRPVKRPKVLLPVRRPEPIEPEEEEIDVEMTVPVVEVPTLDILDFETAISTHTVTKPLHETQKKRKPFATVCKKTTSEDEEWYGMSNSDMETRSSYPRSGTPDSKTMDHKLVSSESNEEQKDANTYMTSETGERIKIVHMKREEIINCHCGFREEDGLMVQCELCLCWQHALCHNIQRESEVPEKYTCSICLNPRRGRRSQRFLHDQDRLYEGLLPGAKACEALRRSHELSGNLLRIDDALHALRVKNYVATKKDHPKLYLWAKDWETGEITMTQEKLNSDYSDLTIMISSVGKENLPVKPDDRDLLGIGTPPSEDHDDRFTHRDNQLGSQALLSGLLSSPGGASLDLPISTSELERLAKTVQEQEARRAEGAAGGGRPMPAPQPEAAIENSACRQRLLRHLQRCQALIDARLDSIEAQVAELESQDPSFEDDETAEYFPRTKQTIQMMMRDLDTMEELGVIT